MSKNQYYTVPTSDLPKELQIGSGPENVIKVVEWLEDNGPGLGDYEFVAFIAQEHCFVMRILPYKKPNDC